MDVLNEAIKDFIARHGGNKKLIAERLGVITPQGLGRIERGERKPPVKLIDAIRRVYGEDLLSREPNGSFVGGPGYDFQAVIATFDKAISTFTKVLESKDKQVEHLENDKTRLENDREWLKSHIDKLTVGLASLKQA